MIEKNKKIFFPFLPKSNLWFWVLFFLIFGLFLSFQSIQAQELTEFAGYETPSIIGLITSYLANLASLIVGAIIMLITWVGLFFLLIASGILGWVTSPGFISFSYTGPDNVFVTTGWLIVRDFANMLFIIILVVIGLATALRIGEYQAKKTLPLLIGIALLINFTPVICGFIIDIPNIIMNFFLEEVGSWNEVGNLFTVAFNNWVAPDWRTFLSASPQRGIQSVATGLSLAFFAFGATVIFLLFALLFIFRYVALWMLVILSPIAFFCYILPATRGIWNSWWNQFIQWCLIGMVGAFFLYLTKAMVKLLGGAQKYGISAGGTGALDAILPALIPLGFLVLGFIATIQTGAMGASYAITAFETGRKKAQAWAVKKAKEWGAVAKGKVSRSFRETLTAPPTLKGTLLGPKEASLGEKATKLALAPATLPIWALRKTRYRKKIEEKLLPSIVESEIRDIKKKEEELSKKEAFESRYKELKYGDEKEKIAATRAIIEKKELKDLQKKLDEKSITEEELVKIGKTALLTHPEVFKKIRDAFPHLVAKMSEGVAEEIKEASGIKVKAEDIDRYTTAIEKRKRIKPSEEKILTRKLIAEARPEVIEKMSFGALKTTEGKEAVNFYWGGDQIAAAARTFRRDYVELQNEMYRSLGRKFYELYNPKHLKYLARTSAREFGFEEPEYKK